MVVVCVCVGVGGCEKLKRKESLSTRKETEMEDVMRGRATESSVACLAFPSTNSVASSGPLGNVVSLTDRAVLYCFWRICTPARLPQLHKGVY